jgi:hypothetical protein
MRIKIMVIAAVLVLVFFVSGWGQATSLEGKVVDGKGQPLANVKVAAKMSQPIKGYEQFETTTGSDGAFKFGKFFPTSEYQLILYSERWTTERKIKTESGPEGQTKMLPEPVTIRFMDSKKGIVLDTKTNLMWAAKDNGAYINLLGMMSYIENYRGGGYTDWRMPTQDELAGLYDSAVTGKNGYHLTNSIELTSCCPVASEASASGAVYFDFTHGDRIFTHQSPGECDRVLPVRSGK